MSINDLHLVQRKRIDKNMLERRARKLESGLEKEWFVFANPDLPDKIAYSKAVSQCLKNPDSNVYKILDDNEIEILKMTAGGLVFYKNNLIWAVSGATGAREYEIEEYAIPKLESMRIIAEMDNIEQNGAKPVRKIIMGRSPCIEFQGIKNELKFSRPYNFPTGAILGWTIDDAYINNHNLKYGEGVKTPECYVNYLNACLDNYLIEPVQLNSEAKEVELKLTDIGKWYVCNVSSCNLPEYYDAKTWKELIATKKKYEAIADAVLNHTDCENTRHDARKFKADIWQILARPKDSTNEAIKYSIDYAYGCIAGEKLLERIKILEKLYEQGKIDIGSRFTSKQLHDLCNELDMRIDLRMLSEPPEIKDLEWLLEDLGFLARHFNEIYGGNKDKFTKYENKLEQARSARSRGDFGEALSIYNDVGWNVRIDAILREKKLNPGKCSSCDGESYSWKDDNIHYVVCEKNLKHSRYSKRKTHVTEAEEDLLAKLKVGA